MKGSLQPFLRVGAAATEEMEAAKLIPLRLDASKPGDSRTVTNFSIAESGNASTMILRRFGEHRPKFHREDGSTERVRTPRRGVIETFLTFLPIRRKFGHSHV